MARSLGVRLESRDPEPEIVVGRELRPAARPRIFVRWAVLAVFAIAFVAAGLHQAGRDGPAVDEGVDVSSGISYLVRHDLRMNPEHPPLPKLVSALPALLADPIVPETEAWHRGDWFDWSDDFVEANQRAGRLDRILLLARSAVVAQGLACAAVLFLITRRFWGPDAGALVAALWLTTPYVVGLSHFALIDLTFTLVVLATSLLLLRQVESPSDRRAAALGLVLGAGLASRHTALVLLLVAAGVVAWAGRDRPRHVVRTLGIMALATLSAVWLIYRVLDPSGPSPSVAANFEGLIGQRSTGSVAARVGAALPMPLEWRAGLAYLDFTSVEKPSYLLGQSWDGGRWWYFPVAAAVKLPATLVVAVVAGWVVTVRWGSHRRLLFLTVVMPGLGLWALLVAQPLNIGLRLAVPVVALSLVGIGGLVGEACRRRSRLLVGCVGVVLLAQVAALASSLPHSLAWTPPPFQPAYRWVSDANLDIGQAADEVQTWAADRDPWWVLDLTRGYRMRYGRPMLGVPPSQVRGWVAVGATSLTRTQRDELSWLRKYCPVGQLGGGAVLLYRFGEPPDPTPGPVQPVGPCWDDPVSSLVAGGT